MIRFMKALGELPNTFWGIIILLLAMRIATHYNAEVGYYFAGIGSTLCGITHAQRQTTTVETPTMQTKVETNASNSTDKN